MGASLETDGWPEFHIVSMRDLGAFVGRVLRVGIKETALMCVGHYEAPVHGAEPFMEAQMELEFTPRYSEMYREWLREGHQPSVAVDKLFGANLSGFGYEDEQV